MPRRKRSSLESISFRLSRLIRDIQKMPADNRSPDVDAGLSILQAALPKFQTEIPPTPGVSRGVKRQSSTKRGPRASTGKYARLLTIAAEFGDDWGKGPNLRKVCKAADDAKLKTPKTWDTDSWVDMMNRSPEIVRSSVFYGIGQAKKTSH